MLSFIKSTVKTDVIIKNAEDVFLELLLAFEKSVTPNKDTDEDIAATHPKAKENLENFIKSIPSKQFKKMFSYFVEQAPKYAPHSLVEGFKLLIQHHIITPAQVIKEFDWILQDILEKNVFEEFTQACELISKPNLGLMFTGAIEDQKQNENIEINSAVNHGVSFSQKWVELKPMLANGKFNKQVQSSMDKKDQTIVLNQGEKNKLMQQWLPLFNQASELAIELNAAASLKTENWLRLFNFFSSKISFNNGSDIEYLFRALRNNRILPSAVYLVELIKQYETLAQPDGARKRIIHSFVQINKQVFENAEWVQAIFLKLYENQFYAEKYNRDYLYSTLEDLINASGVSPKQALMPLVATLKKILSRPKLLHQHYNAFLYSLKTAMHLITKYGVNPFEAKQEGEKSFFAEILLQWKLYREHDLLNQTGEFVPHFYQSEDENIHSFYQIDITCRDQLETFTNYVLWSELFPLLKDEKAFIQHFLDLFGNDINPEEVIAIRNNLIENNSTIKLNEGQAAILQSAVLHKLNKMDVDIESRDLNVFDTILRLLNKKTIYVCDNQFDASSQRYLLTTSNVVNNHENENAKGSIPFLAAHKRHYLLIPVQTVIQNQSLKIRIKATELMGRVDLLKMQHLLEGFVRTIFNRFDFNHKDIYQHVQCIPYMLCSLREDSRELLLQHMLGDVRPHQNREIKQESKNDVTHYRPTDLKSTVIFRSLGLYLTDHVKMQQRFVEAKSQLIKKYQNTYHNHPYFLLLAHGIHPLFYENFKHELSKQFILRHIDNEAFKKLYELYTKKETRSEFDLVRLLDIAENNENLIDQVMLNSLAKLYPHMTSEATQKGVYVILRTLIHKFDRKSSDISIFKKILLSLTNIFERLNPNDNNEKYFTTVTEILRSGNPLMGLSTLIQEMKVTHPLIEDVQEVLPEILKQNNPSAVLQFVEALNGRQLTYRLTEPRYQELLSNILTNIASYEAKNDDAIKIIPTLTKSQDPKSRVNFNVLLASGESWLEFSWKKQQIRNVLQLIQSGADVATLFREEQKTFWMLFLEVITGNPMLLQDVNYLEIMKFSMTKNLEVVYVWLKTLRTEKLIAILAQISDDAVLKQIALQSIKADRFDLLKITNERTRFLTQQDVWSHQGQMQVDFDTTFRKVLCVPAEAKYESFINYPGFYTCHGLIPVFFQGKYELPLLEIGLSTKNDSISDPSKAKEYFEYLSHLYNKHNSVWKHVDNTRNLIDVIIGAFKRAASVLSLQEIITLSASFNALEVPALFPIENNLRSLLAESKSTGTWLESLSKLHDNFRAFEIAGTDPEVVKKQFMECKPSFNDVVSKGAVFSFLHKRDPIEYFFRIFGNVTQMFSSTEEKKENHFETYQSAQPFKWDENEDTRFMGALCKTSKLTLGKTPYHAQFVTIMGTMYAIPDVKKLLIDVASGQGKTLIIAFTAVCMVKQYPQTSFMPVLTLTTHLAKDNADENKPFFDFFKIPSGHDIKDAKTVIRYTTAWDLLFELIDHDVAQVTMDFSKPIDKSNWKLIIDETDIDLSARKDAFVSALGCDYPEMKPILELFWQHKGSSYEDARSYIYTSAAFKVLSVDLQKHITDNFNRFYSKAKEVRDAPLNSGTSGMGAVSSFESSTGISSSNLYGWNGEPQFYQLKTYGYVHTNYQISHYCMYFSDMINQFKMIIGFSGTLGGPLEQNEYKKDGFATVATARFNAKNLKEELPQICDSESEWKNALVQKSTTFLNEGRPVLIFVKKPEDVAPLQTYLKTHLFERKVCQKLNTMLGNEDHEKYRKIVREATEMGTVTVAAMIGGRGVDYQLHNPVIDKKGGLVVITATVVEFENAEIQLRARTARGNNQGLALSIYLRSELTKMLKDAGIKYETLDTNTVAVLLKEMRETLLKERFDKLDENKNNNIRARMSEDFYHNVIPDEKSKEGRIAHYRNRFVFLYYDAAHAHSKIERASVMEKYKKAFKASKLVP